MGISRRWVWMNTSPWSGAIMIVLSSNGWQAILLLRLCIQSRTRVAEYHGPHGWGEEDVEQSISPTLPSISSSLHEGEKYNQLVLARKLVLCILDQCVDLAKFEYCTTDHIR